MRRALLLGVPITAAALAVALAVHLSARLPEGPGAVAWDRVACARCGMLVGDPAFAAQVQLQDGSVRDYDDPGCLLLDLADGGLPPVHAVWLHHHREDRWLRLDESAFEPVGHSPMGYGLATVAVGSPGGLPLAEAERIARRRPGSARPRSRSAP